MPLLAPVMAMTCPSIPDMEHLVWGKHGAGCAEAERSLFLPTGISISGSSAIIA
jgi:hypothetical protein